MEYRNVRRRNEATYDPNNWHGKDASDDPEGVQDNSPVEYGEYIKKGVNEPKNLRMPKKIETVKTSVMDDLMSEMKLYETEDGHAIRKEALKQLHMLLVDWVSAEGRKMGLDTAELSNGGDVGIYLHTFGSYKLNVVAPDGDIDILCVCCRQFCPRETFFATFTERLKADPRCQKLVKVPEAFTPIVKFKFMSIDMDLLYAHVNNSEDAKTLTTVNIFKGLDEPTVRSVNGVRVNQAVLDLVPNVDAFRGALRMIKQWATVRGIYSNVMGFFGGISWAICTAYISQLYPHYSSSQLVLRFFKYFWNFDWNKGIYLTDGGRTSLNTEANSIPDGMLYDPYSARGRSAVMPVITPAYPCMNSTHNATWTTRRIINKEIGRGYELSQKIQNFVVDPDCADSLETYKKLWKKLIEPCNIFDENEYFLFVECYAITEDAFKDYCGFLESKVRLLVKRLETMHSDTVDVRPWPEAINFVPSPEISRPLGSLEGYKFGQSRVIGLEFVEAVQPKLYSKMAHTIGSSNADFRESTSLWLEGMKQWVPCKAQYKDDVNLRIVFRSRRELPSYCRHSYALKMTLTDFQTRRENQKSQP